MEKLTLLRLKSSEKATRGVLLTDAKEPWLVTLENPWKNNRQQISCIPEGEYQCVKHMSPSFGKCYLVKEVEGRDLILFHSGNTEKDTKGCILLGKFYGDLDGEPAVLSSKRAIQEFMYVMKGDPFILEVKSV